MKFQPKTDIIPASSLIGFSSYLNTHKMQQLFLLLHCYNNNVKYRPSCMYDKTNYIQLPGQTKGWKKIMFH